jgi:YbbR domain-containing protein
MIWLSTSMSKIYKIAYDIPIIYKNVPINKKIVKKEPFLKTTISSSGWDLVTKQIKNRTIYLDISEYDKLEKINISDTKSLIKETFSDLTIIDVYPLFFSLQFEKLLSKKVSISLKFKEDFIANFYINKTPILTPDSVTIISDAKGLAEVTQIETVVINVLETDSTIKNIALIIPGNLIADINQTNVKFDIEEFAEKEFVLPINIENKPKNTDLVFYPEEIKLKCLIPFSEFEKIMASDFYISADFNNIEVSKKNTLNLTIREQPNSIRNIQLEKDEIEFIIYSN